MRTDANDLNKRDFQVLATLLNAFWYQRAFKTLLPDIFITAFINFEVLQCRPSIHTSAIPVSVYNYRALKKHFGPKIILRSEAQITKRFHNVTNWKYIAAKKYCYITLSTITAEGCLMLADTAVFNVLPNPEILFDVYARYKLSLCSVYIRPNLDIHMKCFWSL